MFSFILVIVYLSFVYVCVSGKEERQFAYCQRVIINQIKLNQHCSSGLTSAQSSVLCVAARHSSQR